MSWDYDLAAGLRKLSVGKGRAGCCIATVTGETPLTFSAYGGELMASGDALTLTRTAASYAGETRWRTGDKAAALLCGAGLLVIDKIG